MEQRRLGATGLRVSRLGLGTMSWGTSTDEHEAREQLRSFRDAGGTLVDTAPVYGSGASEALLGTLLAETGAREELVVATKAGLTRGPGADLVRDTSRGALLRSLDASLRRLRLDHVDLWQVHVWSAEAPLEETLAALDLAVSSGRAAYVGVSNYTGWQTAQAATWQRAVPGRVPLASTQVEYSLLNRQVELEVLPAAQALGLGVLPYSPLGRGVLTGKYRSGIPADSRGAERASMVDPYLDEDCSRVVEAVLKAADGLDWSPVEVALAWLRDRPGVTAPLLGARTVTQLRVALGVEDCSLPPEIGAALDDVSSPLELPA